MSRSKRIVTVFTTLACCGAPPRERYAEHGVEKCRCPVGDAQARWAVHDRRVSRRKTTDWVSRQAAVLVDALSPQNGGCPGSC